jgi:hypothetical protein
MMGEYYRALSQGRFRLDDALLAVIVIQIVETFKGNGFRFHGLLRFSFKNRR